MRPVKHKADSNRCLAGPCPVCTDDCTFLSMGKTAKWGPEGVVPGHVVGVKTSLAFEIVHFKIGYLTLSKHVLKKLKLLR